MKHSSIAARLALATLASLMLVACSTPTIPPHRIARAAPPPTDCKAWVGADRNQELPGYLLPQAGGGNVCVPLGVTAHKPPANYTGTDYYVDNFTDARLKARWAACKADAGCFKRIDAQRSLAAWSRRAGGHMLLPSSFNQAAALQPTGLPYTAADRCPHSH